MTALDTTPAAPRPRWLTDSPAMAAAALLWAASVPLYAMLVATAPGEIAGEAAWLKPLKFALAVSLWAATLAWAARFLPERTRAARRFRAYAWSVCAAIALEMAWITAASALGQKAHYNTEVPWLVVAYPLAGLVATWFAGSALVWGVALLRATPAPFVRTLGWSMVATFALTVPTAFALSAVEPPAGGLPLFGWTLGAGDLRPAHFAATHAMQIVPLAVLVLGLADRPVGGRATLAWAAATLALAALGLGWLG